MYVHGFHDGAACGYYRVTLPLDWMQSNGHTITTSVGWHEIARRAQIMMGQRIGLQEVLGLWRRMRVHHGLVYELDDDIWHLDPWNIRAIRGFTADVLDASQEAIKISHMVITTTEPLARILRQWNEHVVVVPNTIDPVALEIERPERTTDKVVIGWAGGDSHLGDLQSVAGPLRKFFDRNPNTEMHMVGSDFRQLCRLRGRNTAWTSDVVSYYQKIDFDIGIAPLADTVFNRSKSPIKAIEYGALGIPVVASDIGPYRDYVVDGVTGYLVREPDQWNRYLYELANDEAMRTEMGAKAKQQAAQWTIATGWKWWESAFQSICRGGIT